MPPTTLFCFRERLIEKKLQSLRLSGCRDVGLSDVAFPLSLGVFGTQHVMGSLWNLRPWKNPTQGLCFTDDAVSLRFKGNTTLKSLLISLPSLLGGLSLSESSFCLIYPLLTLPTHCNSLCCNRWALRVGIVHRHGVGHL